MVLSLHHFKRVYNTFLFRDFGEIFGELLPGNFAKLQPPDGQDLMDGLEVKVQLGTVWKQSLTELSGGQRCVIRERQTNKKTNEPPNTDR